MLEQGYGKVMLNKKVFELFKEITPRKKAMKKFFL
jgi:hypothetical protein